MLGLKGLIKGQKAGTCLGLQGSYSFLDLKFKTFSKQYFIFPDGRLTKKVFNRDLEKHRKQAFVMIHCKCTVTKVQCGHTVKENYETYETSHSVIKCFGYGRD